MKQIKITTVLMLIALICYGCLNRSKNSESDFATLISKVPITPLPIGWSNMDMVDSIKCGIAWDERSKVYGIDDYFGLDTRNKYGLNNRYTIRDLRLERELSRTWAKPTDLIFSKRLPDIDGRVVLLYKLNMFDGGVLYLPYWLIVVTDNDGTPLKTNIVAMAELGENDYVGLSFCYITPDYQVYKYLYYEGSEDEDIVNYDGNVETVLYSDFYIYYRGTKSCYYLMDEIDSDNESESLDIVMKKIVSGNESSDILAQYISYGEGNKLRIHTEVLERVSELSTETCSDYFESASDVVNLVAYVATYDKVREKKKREEHPLLKKLTLAQRRKIIAYIVNTLQPLYEKYNPIFDSGYGHIDKYFVGIVDCFWNAMVYDHELLREIERNNCYNLPNLTKLIEELRQQDRFINPETGELEPWRFSPENYLPEDEQDE